MKNKDKEINKVNSSAGNVPVPVNAESSEPALASSDALSVNAKFDDIERHDGDNTDGLVRTPEYERIIDNDIPAHGDGYASVKGKVIGNNRFMWLVIVIMSVLCIVVGVCSSVLTGYFMRRGSTPAVINTGELQQNIAAVVGARKNSIVEVSCRIGSGASNGSGIIIERKNSRYYILTNQHVITGTVEQSVRFSGDDNYYEAEIVGYDSFFDVAVLSVAYNDIVFDDLYGTDVFSRTTEYNEGDYVVAMGNGMSMGIAAYDGIISRSSELLLYNSKTVPVMRTTAAINEGMSGGALFDMSGRIIGLNTYRMNNVEDTSFVTPISIVYSIYEQIIRYGDGGEVGLFSIDFRKSGSTSIGWMSCDRAGFNCEYVNGALTVVSSNVSGLAERDVITQIGGTVVTSDICRTVGELLRYRQSASLSSNAPLVLTLASGARVAIAGFYRYD